MPAIIQLFPNPAIYTRVTGDLPEVLPQAIAPLIASIGSFPPPATDLIISTASHTNDTDFEIGYCDLGEYDPPTIVILTTPTTIDRTIVVGDQRRIYIKCLTAALGTYTTTVTFVSNDPTGPSSIVITYTSAVSGKIISVTPLAHDYGQVLVGDTSAEFLFRVTSIGANPVQVDAPTIPADFVAGATVPSYPVTLPFTDVLEFVAGGTVEYVAGGDIDLVTGINYFDFGISAKPLSYFNIIETMDVNSDADNDPVEVQLLVYGLPITPYGPLESDVEVFLVATDSFNNPPDPISRIPRVSSADPDNLDCERLAILYKQLNFNLPGVPKSTYAFDLHYEDLDEATLGLTLSTVSGDFLQTPLVTAGDDDGLTKVVSSLPVEVQGEIIYMTLEKDADLGPASLTDFIFRHDPFTVRIGESPIPTDITPYMELDDPETLSFMVFVAGMDDVQLATDNARNVDCGLDEINCVEICPLPRKISALLPGNVTMWAQNLRPGPYVYIANPLSCEFGTRFVAIFRHPSDLKVMQAWVSDDMGFSWAVAASTAVTNNIASADSVQDVTDPTNPVIHVTTKQVTTGLVMYHTFNMATKTWVINEAVNGSGTDAASPGSTNNVAICVDSSGNIVIGYSSNQETVGSPRDRWIVQYRIAGVWDGGVAGGRIGQAFSSTFQRVVPGEAGFVRVLFQKSPGGVASAVDDEIQSISPTSHALSSIHTWLTHGISGGCFYGRPWVAEDLSNFLLPQWVSGDFVVYEFDDAADITGPSVTTDQSQSIQYGATGSVNAATVAGRLTNASTAALGMDWAFSANDLWVRENGSLKVSPYIHSSNNLQELAGTFLSLYGNDYLFYLWGIPDGSNTLFMLQKLSDLGTIATMTVADWITALPDQDSDISYTADGCNVMLVGQADQKTEKLPYWEKTFDFTEPSSGGGRTFEHSLYRIFVYYEALGPALWNMTATTRRGQVVTQSRTISSLADGSTQISVFDMKTTDVLQKVRFTVLCGAANIVLISCDSEFKGQYTPPVQT